MSLSELVGGIVAGAAQDVGDVEVVVGRANTLMRQMQYKVPAKSLGKAESCRHIIAVELAFCIESRPFSKAHLIQLAGVAPRDFQSALNLCASFLQVTLTKVAALDVLSVQIDTSLRPAALAVLDDYNRQYVSKLDAARRANIDLSSQVYQAAAFFVAALLQKRKPPLDRRRIIEAAGVDTAAFKTVEKSMLAVLGNDAPKLAAGPIEPSSRPLGAAQGQVQGRIETQAQPAAVNSLLGPQTARAVSVSAISRQIPAAVVTSSLPPAIPRPPASSAVRSVGAVPRVEDKRRASLGLVADSSALRIAEQAEAEAESLRKQENERASYEKARSKILASRKRPAPES